MKAPVRAFESCDCGGGVSEGALQLPQIFGVVDLRFLDVLLPHRIPVLAREARQFPAYALERRLRVGVARALVDALRLSALLDEADQLNGCLRGGGGGGEFMR